MGNTLSGLTPSQTFQGLIKVGNNTNVDGTAKVLSDGAGTDLPMEVSTAGVNLTGSPTVNSVAIANTNEVAAKQDTLVSGTNIKTINSNSLLGSGDVAVQETLVSGVSLKTVNSTSLLGSGDIPIPIVTPSGVSGAIQFSDGSAFASDAANLFWDDANNRLGVGTNAPLYGLDVSQNISGNLFARLQNTNAGGFGMLLNAGSGVGTYTMQWANYLGSGGGRIYPDGVYIGQQSAPTARLQIQGSGSTFATNSFLVQNSNGTNLMRIRDDGQVFCEGGGAFSSTGIIGTAYGLFGGASYEASASLVCGGTTTGFLPPRMTTTQKNAIATPATGLVVYDTTLNKLCVYTTAWETITSL